MLLPFVRRALLSCALLLAPALQAAEFQWLDAQGQQHQLQDLKGQPVVLHLWASWCYPCRLEMPEMAAWLKKNPGIRVLPISLDESAADAEHFMQRIGLNTPVLQTTPSQLYALGSRGLPTTVIIDKSGAIVSMHPGVQSWDESLTRKLQPLFSGSAS